MSTALIALLLISSCLFVVTAFAQAPNVMLARPTVASVTASVLFEQPTESYVVYGAKRTTYTDSTSVVQHKAGVPENVLIGRCIPDTRYYYRIRYRKSGSIAFSSTDEYTFQTQRAPGSSFRFLIEADEHLYDKKGTRSMYLVTLANLAKDSADFLLSLGDIFGDDHTPATTTSADMQELHKDYRQYLGGVCTSMPFFVCLGNYEGEMGYYLKQTPPDNIAVYGTLWRKFYYPNPVSDGFYTGNTAKEAFGVDLSENYYAWTWGDALFIVLDPYWYTTRKPDSLNGWRWTLGKGQYDWLKATLENSEAKFTFVFAHQIIGGDANGRGGVEYADRYEWGGRNIDGTPGFAANRPGWYKPIKDLFKENRVTIFFHGHDHFFCKQQKDCLISQETPQPSLPNFTNASQAEDYGYFEGQILPNSGHLRVTVGPDGTRVDYVRAYRPANETATRRNKDVSASYYIGARNCYDSLTTSVPTLWNADYTSELVFPNPTDRITTVRLRVENRDEAEVRICDAQGVVIRHLLRPSIIEAGEYDIVWDGTTDDGERVADGAYWSLARSARNGEFRSTRIVYVR
ncbi:MAG: metallophosphoesterase [Candidatus Kapaibacterium sp.]